VLVFHPEDQHLTRVVDADLIRSKQAILTPGRSKRLPISAYASRRDAGTGKSNRASAACNSSSSQPSPARIGVA
jgi:hypothetical protein